MKKFLANTFCSVGIISFAIASVLDAQMTSKNLLVFAASLLPESGASEAEWRGLYALRLHQRWSYSVKDAIETSRAAEYLKDIDPEEAADEEVSYATTE